MRTVPEARRPVKDTGSALDPRASKDRSLCSWAGGKALSGLAVQPGLDPKWGKEPGEVQGRKRLVRFCLLGETLGWLVWGAGGEVPEAGTLAASDSPRAKEFFF